MNTIAFSMSAVDGGGYYFDQAPDSVFCQKCDSCIDPNFVPQNIVLDKDDLDACYTYDGRLIVSGRFKELCERTGCQNINFSPVSREAELFRFSATRKLAFDVDRRQTNIGNRCEKCGEFEEVTGATPAFLKGIALPLEEGFYRTDLEFGSGREKSPLVIVGINTAFRLRQVGFKGVEFRPIEK